MLRLVVLCGLAVLSLCSSPKSPPVWPSSYITNGTFTLMPPGTHTLQFRLQMYYDTKLGTNVDYDDGLQTSIQNIALKKSYQVTAAVNKQRCYVSNAGGGPSHLDFLTSANGDAIALQPAVPDMQNYTFVQMVQCPNNMHTMCERWDFTENIGAKQNWYSMLVDRTGSIPSPQRFEFIGHDFLFGSHNDHYVFDYITFVSPYSNPSMVATPKICQNMTETLSASEVSPTPAVRVIHSSAHQQFRHFVTKHGKQYEDQAEYNNRLNKFHTNLAYINNHNADNSKTFKLAVNHFADQDRTERMSPSNFGQLGAWSENPKYLLGTFQRDPTAPLPEAVDWRTKGAVGHVQDQGVCGSCWSFGATGALEGQQYLVNGQLPLLSQQFIIDCCWNEGSQGCNGGFSNAAYDCVKDNGGIPTAEVYGQYKMLNDYCHNNKSTPYDVKISGYVNITMGSIEDTAAAVATKGPLAISIDAALDSFGFYSSGVYDDPNCKADPDDLDHSVLLVGYGFEDGMEYWLVRNQWSLWWGDNGYIKIAKNSHNICGVATAAMYPLVEKN